MAGKSIDIEDFLAAFTAAVNIHSEHFTPSAMSALRPTLATARMRYRIIRLERDLVEPDDDGTVSISAMETADCKARGQARYEFLIAAMKRPDAATAVPDPWELKCFRSEAA